ncbi:MAG: GrrA/OscA1 family cyclophane-containing rSAM-modified RiPP, partial [Synechocystis sp.]
MHINNRSTWMGFVIALATISSLPPASQAAESPVPSSGLEARLANLNTALLQRASTLPTENSVPRPGPDVVAGFANRGGGGGFGNARGGGGLVNAG